MCVLWEVSACILATVVASTASIAHPQWTLSVCEQEGCSLAARGALKHYESGSGPAPCRNLSSEPSRPCSLSLARGQQQFYRHSLTTIDLLRATEVSTKTCAYTTKLRSLRQLQDTVCNADHAAHKVRLIRSQSCRRGRTSSYTEEPAPASQDLTSHQEHTMVEEEMWHPYLYPDAVISTAGDFLRCISL